MRVADIVHDLSVDLNDHAPGYEYVRWSASQLSSYVLEAWLPLAARLWDRKVHHVVVRLEAGTDWHSACRDCTRILRVVGESDADGTVFRHLNRRRDSDTLAWPCEVTRCVATGDGYCMDGYTVNRNDPKLFRVWPPVSGKDVRHVVVECYRRPTAEGFGMGSEIDDDMVAAVKQWALYRALSVDSENNVAVTQLAATHQKTYFQLVDALVAQFLLEREMDDERPDPVRTSSNGSAGQVPGGA